MVWLGILLVVLVLIGALVVVRQARRRRDDRLDGLRPFRLSRRAALEDLAVLGDDAALAAARRGIEDATAEEAVTAALAALRRARPDLDPPCALDPGHGAAERQLAVPEELGAGDIPVCAGCAEAGADVLHPKRVRHGDRLVPWFAVGSTYDAYAHGWFGVTVDPLRSRAAELLAWDEGSQPRDLEGHPTMGAGWFGVLLAANHRMGKYSSG